MPAAWPTAGLCKEMNNQEIIFRPARKEDRDDIARLHFMDEGWIEPWQLTFFKDKVKFFSDIGVNIIAAQKEDRLVGVLIFTKNIHLLKNALLFRGYGLKFLCKFLFGGYGFNKKLFHKIISTLKKRPNPRRPVSSCKINLPRPKIISIVVAKDNRQQGIGIKLMEIAMEQLSQQGAEALHLLVLKNNLPAVKMYEKIGFKVVGESCIRETDSFIMLKKLPH
jgi:RimJ/RimL family protein N-acetyltransferase